MKLITLNPLTNTVANLLQTATIQQAEQIPNPNHAAKLRRMAMNLDKTPRTVGDLDDVGAYLLQTAVLQFALQTTIRSHTEILKSIAKEIEYKVHQINK